jgi:HAD superfamily hydrolase (TIGR01459 family)
MPASTKTVPVIPGLGAISDRYEVVLCDVWGVLHNGREAFPAASAALSAYRARGGVVVLITNAPRPRAPIREQVLKFGLSADAFDEVVTSGDVSIALIAERIDQRVYHIGPQRDLSLFVAAGEQAGRAARLGGPAAADYVLCTGLFNDDFETPADYDGLLSDLAQRKIPFLCANPDLVVHRGESLIYCAGALAESFRAFGGEPLYCGKPHAPIYRVAIETAEAVLGRKVDPRRILAVGDGMRTDMAGAIGQGLDALFVSGGIHFADVHGSRDEAEGLARLFESAHIWPVAAIKALAP